MCRSRSAQNLVGPSDGFEMKAKTGTSYGNATTIATIPAANLTFGSLGTIDGNESLEVDGDASMTVTFGAQIGGTTPLASVAVASPW